MVHPFDLRIITKMAYFKQELISHTRKVCSLYKRVVRNLESWHEDIPDFRYHATLMRHRFDQNKDIKDMRVAVQLLNAGEQELFEKMHPQPKKFPDSPGGIAFGRELQPPDWVLDYWHPLEKAQYPTYFSRREQRKKEYIEMWEKKYGKPTKDSSSSHH